MNDDHAWTDDPAVLLQRRVLLLMRDDVLEQATLLAESLGAEPEQVAHAFDELSSRGLVRTFEWSLADVYTTQAQRTAAGKGLVGNWDAQRSGGRVKSRCSAALLSWLEAHDGDTISSTDQFALDVRAFYFGVPFEPKVTARAAEELTALGLITGIQTWGDAVIRPEITPLGKLVVARYGGDVMQWQASQGSRGTTVNVHGSTGVVVAANSPGANQSVTVATNVSEQVLNLAAALEAILPVLRLEPAQEASARGLVVQLQQAAPEAESDPRKVGKLVSAVRDIAVSAAGGAAGSALLALAEQVAGSL